MRTVRLAGAVAAVVLSLLAGCAGPAGQPAVPGPQSEALATVWERPEPSAVPTVRQGRPARSQRVEFVPQRITLPGRAGAEVQPAETVDGVLEVPENVQHVGWWDGSAYAGEAFGTTVIAGLLERLAVRGQGLLGHGLY